MALLAKHSIQYRDLRYHNHLFCFYRTIVCNRKQTLDPLPCPIHQVQCYEIHSMNVADESAFYQHLEYGNLLVSFHLEVCGQIQSRSEERRVGKECTTHGTIVR